MPATRRSSPRRLVSDSGSLSTYFVSAVIAVIPVIGLVVDGGGQVRAMQQANDIADETARYAGQAIDKGCAIQGAEVEVPLPLARQAAQEFIDNNPADVSLTNVSVKDNGHLVEVQTAVTYEPIFLGMLGMGPKELQGEGEAYQYRTDGTGEEYDPHADAYGQCR